MFDPVIAAILVVVLTAVGAAIFLLGAKATETKAKKVPERVVSKPDACPASPADSSLAAESFTNILNKKPPERVVWEEVEGIKVVEVNEDEIDADDDHHPETKPRGKARLPDREEATALHELWESRNNSPNISPMGSMRIDRNTGTESAPVSARGPAINTPVDAPAEEETTAAVQSTQSNQSEVDEEAEVADQSRLVTPAATEGLIIETHHDDQPRAASTSPDFGAEGVSYDGEEGMEISPRPSEDFGEDRSSLTLDRAPYQKSEATRASRSHSNSNGTSGYSGNSLQRHDSQRSDQRAVSPMRSPTGRLSTTASHYQYKRGGDSWIKNTNAEASAAAASPVSVTPVRYAKPKNIIPVSDDQQPLSLKQGNKINEYESGLQAEKEKVSNRLQETRRKNITDVVTRVLLDGDASQVPDELDPTQILSNLNMDVRKKAIVKQMTMKFSTGGAASQLDSPRGRTDSVEDVGEMRTSEAIAAGDA